MSAIAACADAMAKIRWEAKEDNGTELRELLGLELLRGDSIEFRRFNGIEEDTEPFFKPLLQREPSAVEGALSLA